jgi:hypothetical protein
MLSGTKERVSQYLTLLVRCEEAVGEFYRVCAATWPEEAAFWQNLADEELDHAVRLEMVQARARGRRKGSSTPCSSSPPRGCFSWRRGRIS